jgi:hypothetical protein
MALNNGNRHPKQRDAREARPTPAARAARANDRPILEQAIAINGELRVQLFGMTLLPIKVRLLISSKEVAAQLGLDWWRSPGGTSRKQNGKSVMRARR